VRATQTAAVISITFLLNHALSSPELNGLITRFRESYSSVIVRRESKQLKKSSSWLNSDSALIQHLSEKCDFCVSPFCQVVQKNKLFEVAYYTVNHKKRDILFLTITLANISRFLQCLYHFNREEILNAIVLKFTTSP